MIAKTRCLKGEFSFYFGSIQKFLRPTDARAFMAYELRPASQPLQTSLSRFLI